MEKGVHILKVSQGWKELIKETYPLYDDWNNVVSAVMGLDTVSDWKTGKTNKIIVKGAYIERVGTGYLLKSSLVELRYKYCHSAKELLELMFLHWNRLRELEAVAY